MKEIMSSQGYEEYKATMAAYLAPNSLSNRGRFFCAYCELAFPDQWALEKVILSLSDLTYVRAWEHSSSIPVAFTHR